MTTNHCFFNVLIVDMSRIRQDIWGGKSKGMMCSMHNQSSIKLSSYSINHKNLMPQQISLKPSYCATKFTLCFNIRWEYVYQGTGGEELDLVLFRDD